MKSIQDVTLNRRQLLTVALGASAAFGLAACSNGGGEKKDAPAPAASNADAKQAEAVALDTAAFDKLVADGAKADDAVIAANKWATKVKDAGTLRVGGVETSLLFSQLNEADGKHRGFDAGLFQLLANYILGSPSKYKLTKVQSSTRESVLQSDQVDAVFATYTINDKRKEVISFAGPYFTAHQGILVKADNKDINGIDDLDGKIVGVQEGSNGRSVLAQYAPKAEVQELGSDQELRTALEQGRINAYVVDVTLLMSDMVENPGKYRLAGEFGADDNYGIGLPLDSDGVAFVNDFLKTIEDDGTWAKLYTICIGSRIGETNVPTPPAIGA